MLSCPLPLQPGVTPTPDGLEIAVFSRHAERIHFCVFDARGEAEAERFVLPSRTGDMHHGLLAGGKPGLRYGLRAEGPWDPANGHRFDRSKLLVDPYARQIDRPYRWSPDLALPPQAEVDTAALVPRGVVTTPFEPQIVSREATPGLIYEVLVKAFTARHPDVPEMLRGRLPALQHPRIVEHLHRLGVTHVELMPIAAWMDERHLPPLGLANAWGYNPVGFFALDPRLAPNGAADLEALAKAYAAAGIRVILDVVFNHTAESDVHGATISLRGLDNASYYRHAADDPGLLVNDTGCGHTVDFDEPAVVRMALDAMRHLRRCGVAGFRFDLGTTLARRADGFTTRAPWLAALAQDPELAGCLLIAEPWDLGPGGYQLGRFPAPFMEWNGRYKDDVRRFWRGDAGYAGALATRLSGSADIFQASHRRPDASVNYAAAHDGFTLRDLVSYEEKHNDANGENGRDGTNENFSWNNGVEGETLNARVRAARWRDMRALLATVFVSRGVPMLLAGDEGGRTQLGNNNGYAQDTEAFWLDWTRLDQDLAGFAGGLAAVRRRFAALHRFGYYTGQPAGAGAAPDVRWLSPAGLPMDATDWREADCFGMAIAGSEDEPALLVTFNRSVTDQVFLLPAPDANAVWTRIFCSAEGSCAERHANLEIDVAARSVQMYCAARTVTAEPPASAGVA